MAEKTRQKRESLTKKPFEEMDEAARGQSQGSGGAETLKRAALTAAAGALAAGIAGATKALRDRRSSQAEAEPAEEPPDEGDEPESRPAEPDPLDQASEPEAESEEEGEEGEQEPSEPQAGASGSEGEDEPDGAGAGEAAQIVREARRELEGLLGSKAESVSGFEHADGKWSVKLEVVDVRRVPESTDVLSSYEVVLDDDRNLVSATRLRRYRRSQVEET